MSEIRKPAAPALARGLPLILTILGVPALADDAPRGAGKPVAARTSTAKSDVPEVFEMLKAIVNEEPVGPSFGWFHPGEMRQGWAWLAGRYDKDKDGAIVSGEFTGPKVLFDRLDRDHDGAVKAGDFDWSERSPFVQQASASAAQFRRIDADANGRISGEEWAAFYDRVHKEKGDLTLDDFREALTPPPPTRMTVAKGGRPSTDVPTKEGLLKGLVAGEVGSYREGPRVGDAAPEFTLLTHDRKEKVSLAQFRGRPVVLVFGSVTCGPFRQRFGAIDALQKRYGDKAQFLLVYVREAHPTGGWRMESNDRVGIVADQPTEFDGRADLAHRACSLLKATMPVLVDEIDDRVNDAYSAVPSRHYVIDAEGKVAYKGGRGPFGFKPGELEQALLMTLLEQDARKADAPPTP